MPTTQATDATLNRVGSHSIQLGNDQSNNYALSIMKEECFGYFSATWRGQPVRVTMSCDRYRHSSGMGEWRVYASDAKTIDPDDSRNGDFYYHGPDVSDTARSRLSEACKPLMLAWLEWSADYAESRRAAFARTFKNIATDKMARYNDHPPSRDLRRALDAFGNEIAPQTPAFFRDAVTAFDSFHAALDNAINKRH